MQDTLKRRDDKAVITYSFRRGLAGAVAFVLYLCERRRQRIRLSELDDHLLADVGLKPEDVRRECSKPFWR